MKSLPERPDTDQLKRQAKELLAGYKRGAPEAMRRFRDALPAASGRDDDAVAALGLRLHDAQSCLAREYGFASWADLKTFVEIVRTRETDPAALASTFLRLVYPSDIAGGTNRARPAAAARLLERDPDLPKRDPWIACATGDVETVRHRIDADSAWADRPGGLLKLTPLIAAAHSSLLGVAEYGDRIRATVDLLLDAGADPNRKLTRQWAASNDTPPEEWQVSALHGAAGVNFDPALTRRLLAAGADPNDGESLYHSLDNPVCTPLLLEAGAVVTGTNALFRCLDFDDIETFRLLLAQAAGSEELEDGRLLLWAIRRRRSPAHVEALLAVGVDPAAPTEDGVSAHVQALRYGMPEIAAMLDKAGVGGDAGDEDLFVAACARGDADEARQIQARRPDFPDTLGETRLRMLPELAAAGVNEAVRVMADLGWPIDIRGGDWTASALNQAVFRGDAAMARHLLAHGASWTEKHGFGDNVCGTLGWASLNRPVEDGDWLACAEALVEHGMPVAERDPDYPDYVLVAGRRRLFCEEVTAFLLGEEAGPAASPPRRSGAA